MSDLSISNVITVSLALAGAGAGKYNTANIGLFTDEERQPSFGVEGYKIYRSVTEIGKDFGTTSKTYKMALSIFSQKPNILGAGGYLAVIPILPEAQSITFDAISTGGKFNLNYEGDVTADIAFDATPAVIQAEIRTLDGLEGAIVTGTIAGQLLNVTFEGSEGPLPLMTITGNTLVDAGAGAVGAIVAEEEDGETLAGAITRTESLVQYFGCMATYILNEAEMLLAAAVVQAINKMAFFVSRTAADLDVDGVLDKLRGSSYDKSRGLYYGDGVATDSLAMMAAYASRGMSTIFEGSNTTQTMHLKDLVGVTADKTMTESLLEKAKTAGVDTYVSIQGVSKVFCTQGNTFFDRVFNREWFAGRITIDGFNVLAQVSTKIAQTDSGIASLLGAYRKVCEQAVTNQFVAAGAWNSPETFGNQEDFFNNIEERGYYIYSTPLAEQSAVDREARKAPLAQIAIKEAGAVHSASIIVNINA